ncbi:bsr2111 [Bradyrhizobium diazoefficiens USDA 110]|uniref:Bsr2111 protein n=2 Tax=Bradyrhizobium TaxID=374 RepID=Q89TC7_BRADU|nr:hypothetical protein CIT37_02395 [Bradyrhizobium ottawaense]MYV86993.1 hypothetical protein [Bradyrhizobium japonicum]PDT55575.1 hypothetical protein CO678_43195 [Bradyrhizobium diazoefficiens]QBP20946.1 hypothetical protein Bdiaspc4_10770 [Bradyrhizobium diazoefficiens]BAC47376.1 bsr2111 [Bradyrhizobium diazoefficiens USDA 110]
MQPSLLQPRPESIQTGGQFGELLNADIIKDELLNLFLLLVRILRAMPVSDKRTYLASFMSDFRRTNCLPQAPSIAW